MLINRPAGQNLQKRQEKNQTGIMSAEYNDYNLKKYEIVLGKFAIPFFIHGASTSKCVEIKISECKDKSEKNS